MREPLFWSRPPRKAGVLPFLLSPLAAIWQRVTARRLASGAWVKLPVPVICVGNINAGGTGKTPVVIALLGLLQEMGVAVHVVSRGYGGSEVGPLRVDERIHDSARVGDEPLLVSAFGPAWVARDRVAGARAAIAAGAEVILLDDGFQNPSLHKDLSIVVVDAFAGFGNGRVMPAGPLRESVANGLARADMVLSIGDTQAQQGLSAAWPEVDNMLRFRAELVPLQTGMDWAGQRMIAFAGIGRPAKFFRTLSGLGVDLVAQHAFSDHAEYQPAALQRLLKEAKAKSAQLVTTEKDAARLPASFRREIVTLPVRLVFENQPELQRALNSTITP